MVRTQEPGTSSLIRSICFGPRRERPRRHYRLFAVLRFLALLAICLDSLGVTALAQSARPNFLIIMADDLGWTNTSVQMDPNIPFSKSDYYLTPSLEQMAAEGMRFNQAYAGSPMCSPSRSALLTGRSTAQIQQTDVIAARSITEGYYGQPSMPPIPFHLLEEFTTLPERLKQYAPEYSTSLLRKNHSGSDPQNYGFDLYDFRSRDYEPEGEDPVGVFSMTNHAKAIMEDSVQTGDPFFLMVSPTAIHAPYEYTTEAFAEHNARPRGVRHRHPGIAAMLDDLDVGIGQMLDKLDELGIDDNTYVIFTSDNGGANGARNNEPLFGGKGSIYEGGIRVPMIIKGPGIAANSVSTVPISGTDIFATVSELAGITAPHESGLESASFASVLHNNGVLPEGQVLSRGYGANGEMFWHFPHYTGLAVPSSAVRDGDYKLIKLHGQAGESDQLLLFNLANSVTENNSPGSPLNLANSMPLKAAELEAKLDGWLQHVDAPMAHDIEANAHLLWDATDVGTFPSLWRSKNHVSDLRREAWEVYPENTNPGTIPASQLAQRVAVDPYQPGLGDQAFEFDGNDRMARTFFQVSDIMDSSKDNSVTFDFWFKLSDLDPNKPQILMETGDESGGLSLTIGDADSNGKSNDLRLRMLSKNGTAASATAPLDMFADPTKDFVHATAVIRDGSGQVELYINGALASVGNAQGASSRLDWDGADLAGIGYFSGGDLGGKGGVGDQPFQGYFDGQIAEMSFYNYALSTSSVLENYNSKLTPVKAGISAVAGQAVVPLVRPSNVSFNALQSNDLLVFQERCDVLDEALEVDALVQGGDALSSLGDATSGLLPAGTAFSSYLLHFDPGLAATNVTAEGTIHFGGEILGIVFESNSLATTDPILGSLGNYGSATMRGLVLGAEGGLSISADGKSLNFDLETVSTDLLQLRVLTTLVDVPTFLEADFNQNGKVNGADLEIWQAALGASDEGDADGDGDTDGRDFLIWQRQFIPVPERAPFTADFNGDGSVDDLDLVILQSAYGQTSAGDANLDGKTNGRDYLIWQREASTYEPAQLAAVPEPASIALFFVAGLAGLSCRPRRRL
jgi:arylsulfatase A